jgi:serine/threonine-protein kinase
MLRGKDLRQLLGMGWRATPAQAALIVRRVADALSYAHHKGVIHRDIKPANIFMVSRTQPRVLDFGIARIRQVESLAQRDDPQSRFQEIVGGSPYYMAPEQVRHQAVDRRVDVYALGVVLYELLVGRRAFGGNSLEDIADEVLSKPVPLVHELNPAVPAALSEIVARAMHRDLDQRTRSARRLAGELREWLHSVGADAGQAKATRLPGQARDADGARDWRPLWWTLAAMGWAAALTVGGWMFWQSRATVPAEPPPPDVKPALKAAPPAPLAPPPTATPAQAAPATAVAATPSHAPTPATGTLRLAVEPWAEVWVDGKSMGVTPPLTQLSLPAGAHRVQLRNGDLASKDIAVDVPAGKYTTVRHRF